MLFSIEGILIGLPKANCDNTESRDNCTKCKRKGNFILVGGFYLIKVETNSFEARDMMTLSKLVSKQCKMAVHSMRTRDS